MKKALRAAALLANINIQQAAITVRHNPVLGEEIHIEEELINLEESFAANKAAAESMKSYPDVHRHLVREQRLLLRHCIGQTVRMLQGRRLPRKYSDKDITYAVTKLIRLLVSEALRVGKQIDREILDAVKPFLTLRQRLELGEWSAIDLRLYLQLLKRKVTNIWQTG